MKFTLVDAGNFIVLPLALIGVVVGRALDLGFPATWGSRIQWSAAVLYVFFSIYVLIVKLKPHPCVKYIAENGLLVGWTDDKWAVDRSQFNALVSEYLSKAETVFPGARSAVDGVVVIFREPIWYYHYRRVAGLQDGAVLSVGWAENLSETALRHELGHRILQVLAGDPPEEEAHRILHAHKLS